MTPNNLKVQHFFDADTYTLSYVVFDSASHDAIVIDSVLNYDPASSTYSYESIAELEAFLETNKLKLHYIMDTHVHADHLSGMHVLKENFPEAKTVIGDHITKVQSTFNEIYNFQGKDVDGSQFDILVNESSSLKAGSFEIEVIETPGHTPACVSYHIGNFVFTGDALFMPDYGTGRCDFPMGSAKDLYHSIHEKLYKLPDETLVFTGHDYMPNQRSLRFESSIGEEKESNIQLKQVTEESDYVEFRNQRDQTLNAPRLLLPSIQINIEGGKIPEVENNEKAYLKIPISKANLKK